MWEASNDNLLPTFAQGQLSALSHLRCEMVLWLTFDFIKESKPPLHSLGDKQVLSLYMIHHGKRNF